ncbi:MAG TPA: methyltransferase domain-containing protein [Planctomycetes bacterium]|nr:methyltransferase domain-containing protein [Planctomycetota bacterium]
MLALRFFSAVLLLITIVHSPSAVQADATSDANSILSESGVSAGFVVHLGAGDGSLTAALRQNDLIQVHGLEADPTNVQVARKRIRAAGDYGEVSVVRFNGKQLPYVDNLVNLFVTEDVGDVPLTEIVRVLVPNGVAMVKGADGKWTKTVKPRPDDIDEWSHYLHDASGNSVAHDDVVGPPRHLQWVGSPRWARHHDRMASMSALVSTNGRMFYIMDEGSRISIQLPPRWKLVARDAFNGSMLWKRDIENWQSHLWPLKSGPTQLSRRLVSSGDTVFATLSINAPLTALDARTGETLRTYEGSDATEEIIHTNGLLFLVVRKGKAELADYVPLNATVGDQAKVRELFWDEEPRVVMAFEADTGKQLWATKTKVSPLTLSAHGDNVYFHDGEKLVALNQQTGDVAWNTEPVTRRKTFTFNFGPRMVAYEDVVLYSGGDGKMISVDAATGKELWSAKHPNSGYQSPQDLMVLKGLVWCAPTTAGKDSGVFTGRDPRTGEVIKEFAPDVDTYWFHHRCYIAKATDNFLMPSRTGIEFVDPEKEHWDIHHWVRGGCLYGVMPCNGLTYAPPHNCACYPEAKLFGFNALAPFAPTRPVPGEVSEVGRLELGAAYRSELAAVGSGGADDWPTYRSDAERSGMTTMPIEPKVDNKWSVKIGGRLTSPVIAAGHVYVAQIDTHTIYALDEKSGDEQWTLTAGARIDSPPTVHRGRVVFGGADGWVYCLRASDGELVWRYRAAPLDRRTMAYEQLESLWPVHGSVLIRDDTIYTVAGRSNFLDGGLRLLRLDLKTGTKVSETIMDHTNPATGNNLQEVLQVLQMPVGLPDILSSDDKYVYMKSQKFDLEGNRLEIGPNSGDFAGQASKQRGDGAHLFAPMGYLDDTWFHRSYWVMGQSFAGGHAGYYQAGKFAPSGRILVNGDGYVYGYGRKPEYLRWTTTLEHQLFAAPPEPPEIPEGFLKKGGGGKANSVAVSFGKSPSLDPTSKPLTVEAWMTSTKPRGTIIARGGPTEGFALTLAGGKPQFHIRADRKLTTITAPKRAVGGWHHIAGVLTEDKQMRLYVDGEMVADGEATGLLAGDPAQGMEVGADDQSAVGEYQSPNPFGGVIDEVRLYFTAATDEQIAARFADGDELAADPVLVVGFDDGTARDLSTHRNNGTVGGGKPVEGKVGQGIQFTVGRNQKKAGANKNANKAGGSLVQPKWTADVPIYVRAMVLAGQNLFIVGPPDIIDEESTFQKLTEKDPEVQTLLAQQDAALDGKDGGLLLAVNADTGEVEHRVELGTLPAWDGLAGANGQLFLSTLDGQVMCFGK